MEIGESCPGQLEGGDHAGFCSAIGEPGAMLAERRQAAVVALDCQGGRAAVLRNQLSPSRLVVRPVAGGDATSRYCCQAGSNFPMSCHKPTSWPGCRAPSASAKSAV